MKTPWTYSVTGYQFTGRSHSEIIDVCAAAGFAGIEATPLLFPRGGSAECGRAAADYQTAGLAIDTFHLPFRPEDDITSFYETNRRQAVSEIKGWMETAAALGARAVIQHPSCLHAPPAVEGMDPFIRALDKSLGELLPFAEELKLIIAVENMPSGRHGERFGSRPEHFTEIASRFAHPRLGFCLDTGHALMSAHGEAHRFFETMQPSLAAYHLADNAGDRDSHLAPGRGRVGWNRLFQAMRDAGFTGTACIETPPFDYGPDYSREAWQSLLRETTALSDLALSSEN